MIVLIWLKPFSPGGNKHIIIIINNNELWLCAKVSKTSLYSKQPPQRSSAMNDAHIAYRMCAWSFRLIGYRINFISSFRNDYSWRLRLRLSGDCKVSKFVPWAKGKVSWKVPCKLWILRLERSILWAEMLPPLLEAYRLASLLRQVNITIEVEKISLCQEKGLNWKAVYEVSSFLCM